MEGVPGIHCKRLSYKILTAFLCASSLNQLRAGFCAFRDSYPKLSPQYTYPRQLMAYKTIVPPEIDGHIFDSAWEGTDWSESFVDISSSTPPRFQTQAKVMWDFDWLYVAARLIEPCTWANLSLHSEVRALCLRTHALMHLLILVPSIGNFQR